MADEGLSIDHVIYGVRDLEEASQRLRDQHRLLFTDQGGVHPGGTKNGSAGFDTGQYIELLAVENPDKPVGGWLNKRIADGDRFVGWALRTEDIDAVCARLDLTPEHGSIDYPDGQTFGWRWAGRRGAIDIPSFIQYDPPPADWLSGRAERQAQRRAEQSKLGVEPTGIAWVEVAADEGKFNDWLGGADLPVRVVEGRPGVRAVAVATSTGDIVIRS